MDTYHDFLSCEILKSAHVYMARLGVEGAAHYTKNAELLRDYLAVVSENMAKDFGVISFSRLVQDRVWAGLHIVASATVKSDEKACRRFACVCVCVCGE